MARSPKLLIFLTVFIDLLGFGILVPILAPTCAAFLGDASGHIGFAAAALMSAFSILQMLFSPFWGRMSDRYGRRPILLISLCGSTFSYILFALSGSYAVLLISRVFAGISAANITAAQAYIADITPPEERTAGMGLIGMAFGLGFALGPVFGGIATSVWTHLHPGFLPTEEHIGAGIAAAMICFANLVWAWFELPESLPAELRGKTRYRRFAGLGETFGTLSAPVIGPLIVLFFLITFAFSNVEVSFTLYAERELALALKDIYGLFIFIGLVMAFTQGFLIRRLVKRIPEETLMIAGGAILAVGLILLPMWKQRPLMLMSLGVLSVGQGLCQPCVLSLISRRTSAQSQGNVFGANQSMSSLARVVGPVFGGLFFDLGPRLPFWIAAVIMAGSLFWAAETRRRIQAENPAATP